MTGTGEEVNIPSAICCLAALPPCCPRATPLCFSSPSATVQQAERRKQGPAENRAPPLPLQEVRTHDI